MEENNNQEVVQETIVQETTPTVKKTNGAALASFILSLVGLIIAGIPCGIAATITGITGLVKFNKETQKNKWMAIFGLILGIIDVVLVATALPAIYEQMGIL